MSVTVSWADEARTIIRLDFSEPYTGQDYLNALLAQEPYFDAATVEIVHLIYCHNGLPMPEGLFKNIPNIRKKSPATNHPRSGKIIYVDMSPGWEAALNVYLNVYPEQRDKFRFTKTIEEAFALIERLEFDPSAK